MSSKNTQFYRNNRAVLVDFSAEAISSDGAIVLLEKLERKHKVLDYFSKLIHPIIAIRLVLFIA